MSMAFIKTDDSGEWIKSPDQSTIDAQREQFLAEQDARLESRARVNLARRNLKDALDLLGMLA